jgi:predicted amidophosphoribosyltransferase
LLRQFDVVYDCLVAYEDTKQHKPDPEPINKALAELGVAADHAFHLGDAPADQEACYHAGVLSIGALWGVQNLGDFSSSAPDVLLARPDALLTLAPHQFYVADALARGYEPMMHGGSILQCGGDPVRYSLGRYFKTEDARHAGDAFCAKVLALKNDDGPAPLFGRALAEFLAHLDWRPSAIVPVPPKPSQTRNRFAAVLANLEPTLGEGTDIMLDGLTCVKEIEGYKKMSALQRAAAMPGTFETKYRWDGDRVLLIDDVLTTGETVAECARVLLADGAKEIRIVTLGKDQRSYARELCPQCDRPLSVKTNGKSGAQFWGCTGYRRNAPDSCNYTRSM